MKFDLYYSAGASFGQMDDPQEEAQEFSSIARAEEAAYQGAIEEYDSFVGIHGVLTVEEIMEEEDVDEETAGQIFHENRESEIDFKAVLVKENKEKEEIKKNAGA